MSSSQHNNDVADLVMLLKSVWYKRRLVLLVTTIITLFGVFIYFISPEEYEVKTSMIPEGGAAQGQGIKRWASFALNLNLSSGESDIRASLYPQLVSSIPFKQELLKIDVYARREKRWMTLKQYMLEVDQPSASKVLFQNSFGLPLKIIKLFKGDPPRVEKSYSEIDSLPSLTNFDYSALGRLNERIELEFNEADGILSLSVTMQDPEAAAQVATSAQQILKRLVKELKSKNALKQLEYTSQLFEQKKIAFEKAQRKLSLWRDEHRIVSTSKALDTQQNLQSEYNLSLSIYSEFAKQLETVKLDVQKSAPNFIIIDPVLVPKQPTSPVAIKIILVAVFVGLFISIAAVLFLSVLSYLKSRW